MEEELCYSTVCFKPFDNQKSTVPQLEESVLYAEVKRKQSTSQTPPETSAAERSLNKSVLPAHDSLTEAKYAATPIFSAYRRATVFLGLFCFLLLAALTAVSVFNYIHMSKYNNILVQHTQAKATNLQLLADKEVLERERARLTTQGEQMNGTLDFILKKSSFLVDEYCQSTGNGVQCTPCPQKWIQNGSSCYYFNEDWPWKTWTGSQEYCEGYGAQLAIIDSVEEQEFINQQTESYYDEYHGYWIGLSEKKEETWVWTTGAELEGGFWVNGPSKGYMECVLSVPSKNPLKSWISASCYMRNRWICEVDVLTWPTFLQAQQNQSGPST
ncbi:C-type lectin domain family 9 member A-like isoform X1 [Sinocyclocheilus rhinocerous]|uniref:C-type lectin domain family 9 member A-like isoform X1 n=1 Tax=Sinocyclocheilus rhinocerous TaxID=307959 RepID=UPI0007BAC588|nr:PREDICTED: C-type lectin domain family 9 member A-like isoform X1 [Sinocyclocheilus rhinocerous]